MVLAGILRRGALALLLMAVYPGHAVAATDPAVLQAQVEALPGVTSVVQAPSPIADTLFFQIEFFQPVDHANPAGPGFQQRATLLHRDESLPMVLVTEGYATSMTLRQSELTYYLQANQLRVEHRFFVSSSPIPQDWSKLDIAQAAADHHAIVTSFKQIYPDRWIATGASKSGMASVYYRYFYPDDVVATVPYVAPTSHRTDDASYVQFLANVGPADCRAQLRAFQKLALSRRDALLPMIPDPGDYGYLGQDRALEFAIVELPFAFWQYQDASLCPAIPPAGSSDAELLDFIDGVVGLDSYADALMDYFSPYYYQAATQLGGPRFDQRGLMNLLRYPYQDILENYPPYVEKTFDYMAMRNVELWLRAHGERVLLIYGANDPWSSRAFDVRASNDSYRIFVDGLGGNHGASLARMTEADRNFALGKIQSWLGMSLAAKRQTIGSRGRDRHGIDPPSRAELNAALEALRR